MTVYMCDRCNRMIDPNLRGENGPFRVEVDRVLHRMDLCETCFAGFRSAVISSTTPIAKGSGR